MKIFLLILNIVNYLGLFTFIPFLVYGSDVFLVKPENESGVFVFTVTQILIFLFVALFTSIVAKIKHIKTTRDGFEVIKNTTKPAKIFVLIALIICIISGLIFFEDEIAYYVFITLFHSISVMMCDYILKKC